MCEIGPGTGRARLTGDEARSYRRARRGILAVVANAAMRSVVRVHLGAYSAGGARAGKKTIAARWVARDVY